MVDDEAVGGLLLLMMKIVLSLLMYAIMLRYDKPSLPRDDYFYELLTFTMTIIMRYHLNSA